uniref:Uncharacterized protein n=1 Tax=Opuntia streptacantha TaxID=393608 RepID=A0A7C9EHV1_OPUST
MCPIVQFRDKAAKLDPHSEPKEKLFRHKVIWSILNFTTYLFNKFTGQDNSFDSIDLKFCQMYVKFLSLLVSTLSDLSFTVYTLVQCVQIKKLEMELDLGNGSFNSWSSIQI